jgi:hypothetical protein
VLSTEGHAGDFSRNLPRLCQALGQTGRPPLRHVELKNGAESAYSNTPGPLYVEEG